MGASTYAGIEREFSISQEIAILNVSLFVLGLRCGSFFTNLVNEPRLTDPPSFPSASALDLSS